MELSRSNILDISPVQTEPSVRSAVVCGEEVDLLDVDAAIALMKGADSMRGRKAYRAFRRLYARLRADAPAADDKKLRWQAVRGAFKAIGVRFVDVTP